MLRVIAGEHRGRKLATPPGRATRPTGDRVRESLFNLLGPAVDGARVLDLFAGSGALGIEALSRGAAHAVFVERNRDALRALRANVAALRLEGRCTILPGDAWDDSGAAAGPFDLILADPPWGDEVEERVVAAAARRLSPGGMLVLEHPARRPSPEPPFGLPVLKARRYGDTALTLYVRGPREES